MNTPNPLVPQGTFPDKGKAQIRITVFAILAIHVMLLGVLLIAGCNKKAGPDAAQDSTGLPALPPPVEPWPTPPTSPAPTEVTQEVAHLAPPPVPVATEVVTPTPPAPPEPVFAGYTEHVIAKGESFYTLGKKYNVGFKAIAEANPNINPNRLKIGEKVKIPPPKTPGAASLNGTSAISNGGEPGVKTYKVKSGDSLLKIAKTFGVTAKQVRSANNLTTDQIKVGQTLKIPAKTAPSEAETVAPVPAVPPPGIP
jgi:LysM repeat protein